MATDNNKNKKKDGDGTGQNVNHDIQAHIPFSSIPFTKITVASEAEIDPKSKITSSSNEPTPFGAFTVDDSGKKENIVILKPYVVKGTISRSDGAPFANVLIRVFDFDVRGEEPLGAQITDYKGYYEIHYSSEQFKRAEKDTADLIFRLLDPTEKELTNFTAMDEFGTSLTKLNILDDAGKPSFMFIKFNAPLEQTVDFSVIPDWGLLSEYERLIQQLEPLLVNVKIPNITQITLVDKLADLRSDEIDFLSAETGTDRQKIEFLVVSATLEKRATKQEFRIPTEAFYGLARAKGLIDFPSLARTSIDDLRTSLIQAGGIKQHSKDNIIPPFESEELLNLIVQSIHRLAITSALNTPQVEGKPTLAQALNPVLPSATQQMALLQEFANHTGTVGEFWNNLRQLPDFQEQGKVDKIQFVLQVAALTQNSLSLTNATRNKFQSMRQLARTDAKELTAFIKNAASDVPLDFPGDTKEEKLELYSASIVGILQGAFPTEAVTQVFSKITNATLNGIMPSTIALFLTRATDLNVVRRGEEFEINSTHIDKFIGKYGAKIFAGIDGVDKDMLTSHVKRAQRLFQISSSPETFQTLIESKFNSANEIAQMSLRSLKAKFEGKIDAPEIELIHQRAMAASAATLHLALQAYQSVTDAYPIVIDSGLKQLPDWATLFGSLDMCNCQDCRSVYSPAAYFVDLLEFLRKSSENEQGFTPLDVLIGKSGKRPDLAYIQLTCENTNTLIPYIDLVNEVLESYIELAGHLDQTTAKDTGDSTAEELKSNPQYIDDAAYDKLREAVFPPTYLPFDRSLDIARLYLDYLGASRYKVMNAFGGNNFQLASEYLDLTEKDFEIVAAVNFDGHPSLVKLDALYVYQDENLTPTLQFKTQFTPDQIMSGIAVVILQAKMNTDGANPKLTLSGKYDAVTEAAVKVFQQKHGLAVNGIVDNSNWVVLSTIQPDAVGALVTGVTDFLKRTELSYLELIELLKTRYINPNQQFFAELENTGITNTEIRSLLQSNFTNANPTILAKLAQAGLSLNDVKKLIEQLLRTIVLYSAVDDCDLSKTLIQYLDGNSIEDSDLWKIQRFIRLWRKLAWTIPEIDSSLISLGYSDQIDANGLQKLSMIKELQTKLNLPLIKLLGFWANIDTYGKDSLYKKLFLNKTILRMDDDVFKYKPDGSVLDGSQTISTHIPTLLAAFQMNEADLHSIRVDIDLATDGAPLTLANVSAIYRYSVLSKALHLKVKDLIALKTLSGLDPFVTKTPAATLAFIDMVNQVKSSGFTIGQLNYLYRHIWEVNSGVAPQSDAVALLVANLKEGLQTIAQNNALVPDPSGEVTRNKLAMIVDGSVAEQTIQMVLKTASSFSAPLDNMPGGIAFDLSVKNKIFYDQATKKIQFEGLMTQGEHDLMISASPSDVNYQAAVNKVFQQSTDFIQQSVSFIGKNLADFVNPADAKSQLLTSSINTEGKTDATAIAQKFAYLLKFLIPRLYEKLSRSLVKQTLSENLKLESTITQVLLESVLKSTIDSNKPAIADFLALAGDGLSATYFNNATLTAGGPTVNRVDSTVSFSWGKNSPDPSINQPTFSVRWTGKLFAQYNETYTFYLHANGSLRLWIDNQSIGDQGAIDLKAGQLYDIKVEYARTDVNTDAIAELKWSSAPSTAKSVIPQSHLYSGTVFDSFDKTLKSYYLLHKIALLVNKFNITAKEILYLSTHSDDFSGVDPKDPTQKAPFNLNVLLPLDPSGFKPALFDQWRRLFGLFSMRDGFQKTDNINLVDVFGFAANAADKSQLSRDIIKQLAITVSQNSNFITLLSNWVNVSETALKQVLLSDWTGLSEMAIKTLIVDKNQPLTNFINVLAKLTDLQVLSLILAAVTSWDLTELTTLIAPQRLNLTLASFKDERSIIKIQGCMQLIRRLGISSEKLFNWATQIPDPHQAQDIKNTVKAKYDEETWLTVAQPLSDKLRDRQRASLVAYVLAMPEIRKSNVSDSDRLFEYFLIDVNMGACMATSRIKQAISSVQLFVQRCLLNLEPRVHPIAIDAARWEWMKNYRVWEANRKVFLYPENWIEPGLRDDKSPFFKDLESELLQNDLTNEIAQKALLNYLYKLDQVARLEICGMYLQEDFEQGEEYQSILHVFGRSMGGMTRSYYYRRLIDNKTWSPWEKVELDIHSLQGDDRDYSPRSDDPLPVLQSGIHLLPVIWNRRLYLFWLVLTKKTKSKQVSPKIDTSAIDALQPTLFWEIKLAWSKYDQGKWNPKQVSNDAIKGYYEWYNPNDYRIRALVGGDNSLELHLYEGYGDAIGKYRFEDHHSDARIFEGRQNDVVKDIEPSLNSAVGSSEGPYFMGYIANKGLNLIIPEQENEVDIPILYNTPTYTLLSLSQYYPWPLSAPYFYQDKDGTYFVRSRKDYELIFIQIKNPDSVIPHIYEGPIYSAFNIVDQLHPPSPDPVMSKAVINPWILAEQKIIPKRLKTISDQSGVVL